MTGMHPTSSPNPHTNSSCSNALRRLCQLLSYISSLHRAMSKSSGGNSDQLKGSLGRGAVVMQSVSDVRPTVAP
jgi:hypothetical protein